MTEQEIIVNRFEQILGEWICIHDNQTTEKDTQHFPDLDSPSIKLCSATLRIRANDAWTKLPKEHKEFMVAHEMGHREYQHYLNPTRLFRALIAVEGSVAETELQADAYAVRQIGKDRVIKCLTYMRSRALEAGHVLSAMELERRIEKVNG